MAKPEWGAKRICGSCGARFYDMRRNPIICPKCDTEFTVEEPAARRRPRPAPVEVKPPEDAADPVVDEKAAIVDDDDDEEIEEELAEIDDESDDDVIEDTSDLGEDDDDMAEVLEHTETGEKE